MLCDPPSLTADVVPSGAAVRSVAIATSKRIIVIGSGARAVRAIRALRTEGHVLVGAIDDEPQPVLKTHAPDVPCLGGLQQLVGAAVAEEAEELYVAMPIRSGIAAWSEASAVARRLGINAVFEFDLLTAGPSTELRHPGPTGTPAFVYGVHSSQRPFLRWVKRIIDLICASVAVVTLAPIFLASALAIKLTSPGPVLFRQERLTRGRRRFSMLKFRTMVVDAERLRDANRTVDPRGIVFKVANDPRVTPVGWLLRRLSVDELPQLFNVIRGEMSLVGPRPIPTWVYERVDDPDFHRRFAMPAGMTGLWQVNGREQNFERMARCDLEYIDRWSLGLDLRLLLRTPLAVLRGTGAR